MGKMKISKTAKKANGGMPTWLLSLIIAVIALGVILGCAIAFINSTGVIPRMSTAMKTENFKVSQNMMNYFYQNAYSSFVSNSTYSALSSYCSLNSGDNAGKPLYKQTIGAGQYDSILASGYEDKTWHEFFMDQAISSAKSLLIYCEVANERGVSLTDEDRENAKLSAESLALQIKYSGEAYLSMSENACISAAFGTGVKLTDVKKAMELSVLASKVQEEIQDELLEAITSDRINAEYEANKKNYETVDFLSYTFSVKYDTVAKEVLAEKGEDAKEEDYKEDILKAYAEKVAEAASHAKKLSEITDKDEFIKYILAYTLSENYDDIYADVKEDEKLESDDLPSEENVAAIKEAMINKLLEEVTAEDRKDDAEDDVSEADGKFSAYGVEVTESYGEFLTALKSELYSKLISAESSATQEEYGYTAPEEDEEEDPDQKWLFADDRKEGEVTVIEDGDGKDGAEVTEAKDKYYKAGVYYMVKTRYKDDTIVRNGAYAVFEKSDYAKDAIEAIKALDSVDVDAFLAACYKEGAGTYSNLEDYRPGLMGSEEFDSWFFDENRKKGDYTEETITAGSSSYILGYFEEVGTLKAWEADVKSVLFGQDAEASDEAYTEKYESAIVIKDSVINRVGK